MSYGLHSKAGGISFTTRENNITYAVALKLLSVFKLLSQSVLICVIYLIEIQKRNTVLGKIGYYMRQRIRSLACATMAKNLSVIIFSHLLPRELNIDDPAYWNIATPAGTV